MMIASLTAVNTALVALGYAWQAKRTTSKKKFLKNFLESVDTVNSKCYTKVNKLSKGQKKTI